MKTHGVFGLTSAPSCRASLKHLSLLPLLMMPMLLSGCLTANTIYSASHPCTRYLHDEVKRVDKAVIADDSKLVVSMEGKMAGSSKPGPFTASAKLPGPEVKPHALTIHRNAVVAGWRPASAEGTNLLTVAIAPPVILPDHQYFYSEKRELPGVAVADRSLYLVQNEAHDEHPSLVLVTKDRLPRQTVYRLETQNVIVPHRYYLLLWLPLTIPVDAATLPLQILAYPLFKSINC